MGGWLNDELLYRWEERGGRGGWNEVLWGENGWVGGEIEEEEGGGFYVCRRHGEGFSHVGSNT